MALTNSQKMLILVVLLLILGYFIYNSCDSFKSVEKFAGNASSSAASPYSNKDTISMDSTMTSNSNDSSMSSGSNASSMSSGSNASSMSYDSDESSISTASNASNATEPDYTMNVQTNASVVPSAETIDIRRGKNANYDKSYKSMNYKDAPRGGSGELDKFFMDGNVENTGNNTQFSAADDVSDKYAAYQTSQMKNGSTGKSDEGLLPVEEKDWFEDVTPTKIKNRHLINIYRPVGVNTISSSLKNPSLDLRGTPANAKTVVSPFLNSSIEPDHNIRGLCM